MKYYKNQETAVIELQKADSNTGPVNCIEAFRDLASSTPPEIVGIIPNIDLFSASLGWDEFAPKQEFYIKAPGTHVVLPPDLQQFAPTLKNIFQQRGAQTIADEYCIMGVVQSRFNPNSNSSKPFVNAHKDLTLNRLQREPVPVSEVFIACDSLSTGFSSRTLSSEELAKIEKATAPDQTMQDILANWHYQSLGAGLITKHDTTTAHALANPDTPTVRTAVILNFTMDADINLALSSTPGLMQFDHETWETKMKPEFSVLEI